MVWFYTVLPGQDLGLAIIALTVAIRVLLTPLLAKGQKAQKNLALLQPEIKKIQDNLKNNREAQSRALMELYAKHKVNPFSGCLLMVLQLPVLIALFGVFRSGLEPSALSYLYAFVENPGALNPLAFGLLDLSKGNLYLGAVAALTQYFQTKLTMPQQSPRSGGDFARALSQQSLYIFPVVILVWSYTLPSALTLYWTVLNVFGILQELIVKRLSNKPLS